MPNIPLPYISFLNYCAIIIDCEDVMIQPNTNEHGQDGWKFNKAWNVTGWTEIKLLQLVDYNLIYANKAGHIQ